MKIKQQFGFGFFEMSIVMLIFGSLIIVAMPSLKSVVIDTKRKQGLENVISALGALKGYAVANGAFPDFPNDGGGANIVYQLPTAKLGLQSKSEYNDIIYYDVNDALQFASEAAEATGQSTDTFCTAVLAEIDKVVTVITTDDPEPRLCDATTSCTPATVADQTSVALVLITRGKNSALDDNNGDGDRVYENSARGQGTTYDDVMKTMTLYEVSTYFGCSDDVSGSWGTNWSGNSGINCGANAPTVVLHNAGAIDMYANQKNQVCWKVTPGDYIAFCNTAGWGASIDIDVSADADCSTAIGNSGTYTISAASDTSADGDIRVSCTDVYSTCTVD